MARLRSVAIRGGSRPQGTKTAINGGASIPPAYGSEVRNFHHGEPWRRGNGRDESRRYGFTTQELLASDADDRLSRQRLAVAATARAETTESRYGGRRGPRSYKAWQRH